MPLKIGLITTYPPQRCGIGTYSQNLAHALARAGHQVTVIAEMDKVPAQTVDGSIPIYRTWSRRTPGGAYSLRNMLDNYIKGGSEKPDVLLIQHEFGLFPDHDVVVDILEKTPSVITLHTVETSQHYFNSRLGPNVITHTVEAQAIVPSWGVPHGCTIHDVQPSKQYYLNPGFVGPGKGTLEIIDAYNEALRDGNLPSLVIAGLCRDERFEFEIRGKVAHYGLGSKVELRLEYQTDTHELYANAIAVVLGANSDPRANHPYSASGQLATSIGYGLPVLARNVPIYRSQPGAGVCYYQNTTELARLFRSVMRKDLWNSLHQMSKSAAVSWDEVAEYHVEIFRSLAKGKDNGTTVVSEPGRASASR